MRVIGPLIDELFHMDLECDIASLLGTQSSILYYQGFSTISCAASAFATRGDVIVADRAINFAIQKGLQISRCTVRWFERDHPRSLEHLLSVETQQRNRPGSLARRFVVTEGMFEKDCAVVDLPKTHTLCR